MWVHVQLASIWFDAGASTAQRCASGISILWFNAVYQASKLLNMAQCCESCINNVHQVSIQLNAMHQAHYGTILLNAVQALIYGPMLCIRHHNMGGGTVCQLGGGNSLIFITSRTQFSFSTLRSGLQNYTKWPHENSQVTTRSLATQKDSRLWTMLQKASNELLRMCLQAWHNKKWEGGEARPPQLPRFRRLCTIWLKPVMIQSWLDPVHP